MKRKIKPKGHWEECPVCDGTGACKIYTFDEAKWLMDMKEWIIRIGIMMDGRVRK
jgi:hypothetical protein